MNPSKKNRAIESLFILLIFTVFMVTSLLTVMIGANVYRKVVGGDQINNALRASFPTSPTRSARPTQTAACASSRRTTAPSYASQTDFGGEIFHLHLPTASLRNISHTRRTRLIQKAGDIIRNRILFHGAGG